MTDLIGYVSSILVSFGLAAGFLIGGLIFFMFFFYGLIFIFEEFLRVNEYLFGESEVLIAVN